MSALTYFRASYCLLCRTKPLIPTTTIYIQCHRFSVKSKGRQEIDKKRGMTPSLKLKSTYHGLKNSPIDEFFAQYPKFDFDSSKPLIEEFRRLRRHLGLYRRKGSMDEKKEARLKMFENAFKEAMVLEFNDIYGTDANDVACWWGLCNALGIHTPPERWEECEKVVKSKYVNIIDFLEANRRGQKIKIYETLPELQAYTNRKRWYFPLHHAKAGNVLCGLLQHIRN